MADATQFAVGQTIQASDGMSPWEDAVVIAGPIQSLTSCEILFHIRFTDDNEEYIALPDEMRKAGAS